MNSRFFSRLLPPLLASLAGVVQACSFAPWNLPWLQVLALTALFALAARASSARSAALLGFAFGLGWFGVGVSWVYVSMHVYGRMPAALAGAATAAFCAVLSLYPALALGVTHRLIARPTVRVMIGLPAAWTISEWLRATVFTGFPWLATGYAHTDGPLAGWAPTLGVHGVTLFAALLAGAFASLTLLKRARAMHSSRVALAAAIAGAAVGGGWFSGTLRWTHPTGAPISVRLVQANVPQNLKFEPDGAARAFSAHWTLMQGPRVDLIALPESIFPLPMQLLPPAYPQAFRDFTREHRTGLIFGVFLEEPRGYYYNSALAYVPTETSASNEAGLQHYSKRHLVPFGEFIPPGFRWFVDLMHMPIGDQQRGRSAQPMQVAGQRVAVNICYEDLFGAEIIDAWRADPAPTMMLNMSNLAWFNDSLALPQHLQISRMRVLETQHPMLRATNTGATAIIDARGEVVAQLPYLTAAALTGEVQGHEGTTPFIRYGNWTALALACVLLAIALLIRRQS